MTITIPTNVQSAGADAMVDLADVNPPGTITIYDGARPAANDAVTTQNALAAFTLNNPAFGAAVNGVKTLDVDPALTTTGDAAGTATWARVTDGNGATVFDGSVGGSGSGADFEMSTTTVSVGLDLELTAGTMTQPSGE